MKKYIIFVFLTISTLFSQDMEPTQIPFQFIGISNFYINGNSGYFQLNHTLRGWQWGGTDKVTTAMRMNQCHFSNTNNDYSVVADSTFIVRGTDEIWTTGSGNAASNCMAMQYEPTLRITKPGFLETRLSDNTNPVWGFKYIHPDITINSSDTRLKLVSTGSYVDSLILGSPWPNNEIHRHGAQIDDIYPYSGNNFNGVNLFLSINLRRGDITDNLMTNDTILRLRIMRNKGNDSGYIRFQQVPDSTRTATSSIISTLNVTPAINLGLSRNLIVDGTNPDAIYIMKKMLPADTQNITISGYFICDNSPSHNPELIYLQDSLNIEVTYYGHCNTDIDWIRIENTNSRKLFRGGWDLKLKQNIQTDLTALQNAGRGIRAFRFYMRDESSPAFFNGYRYINKLIGNVCVTQDGGIYSPQYFHHVGTPERWINFRSPDQRVAVPYFNNQLIPGTYYYKTLGLGPGYNGKNSSDSLTSGYETYLVDNVSFDTVKNTPNMSYYVDHLFAEANASSFQGYLERKMYEHYVTPYYNFAYQNKNWWSQIFIGSNWGVYEDVGVKHLRNSNVRPKTGEEINALCFQQILMGSKGLIYDRESSDKPVHFEGIIDCVNSLISFNESSINDDNYGADFIKTNDLCGFTDITLLPLDTIAKYMSVKNDRVYIGQKSTRVVLKRLHDWMISNDATIMKLRLACWLGKGFKTWYNQDSARFGTANLLTKLIDTANIRTRPIGRTRDTVIGGNTYTVPYFENYHGIDSSFYDITCLRDTTNNEMDKYFILGIQNRRSDPLVLWDYGGGRKEMRFFSTAEFEDSCHSTNPNIDTLKFQDYFSKRLGIRELCIPFHYRKSALADNYTLIHVTELGYDDTTLNKQPWRDKKYYHLIDTIVHRDSVCKIRLLPGEGKLLKCQILNSPDITFEGYLHHSNQRKIVAYPYLQTSAVQIPSDTSTYRYHAVFHKPIEGDPTRYGVYYRRSYPMKRQLNNNQIDWEPVNYLLSDSIIINNPYTEDSIKKSRNCGYPSIVVRYDPTLQKSMAYVVYACDNELASIEDPNLFIIENIFDPNAEVIQNDSFPTRIKYGRQLALARCDFETGILRWGTPMINASSNGNYYCWSDSLTGIVAGFKAADQLYFGRGQLDTISWSAQPMDMLARHPSLNTYSRIYSGETDCALVWQEKHKDSTDDYFNINYTRLKIDLTSGVLMHYLPKRKCNPAFTFFGVIKENDSDMVRLTNPELPSQYYYNKFMYPAVYRGIELGAACCYDTNACHSDRVVWQGTDQGGTDVIWISGIQMLDTINTQTGEWLPDCWNIPGLSSIRSLNKSLYHPDIAQGCLQKIGASSYDNKGDSIAVINFVQMNLGQDPTINGKLWQVWSDYFGFFEDYDTLRSEYTNYSYARPIVGTGNYPHLASMPMINDDSCWQRNRRIYQTSSITTAPRIITSLEWFYRNSEEESELSYPFFGFVHDSSKTMYSSIYLKDTYGKTLKPFIKTHENDENNRIPLDTIYSDWFEVKDLKRMRFYGKSNGTQLMSAFLERARDNRTYQLPAQFYSDKIVKHNYQLINGGENRFRFKIIKNIRNSVYTEDLYIDGLPDIKDFENELDNDKFGRYVEETQEQIIDLGDERQEKGYDKISISLYPNPANELVYTTAYMPYSDVVKYNKMTIKVFSNLGLELYRQDVKSGETITINTKNYPQGAYFIRAEEQSDRFFTEKQSPAVQGFVIRR